LREIVFPFVGPGIAPLCAETAMFLRMQQRPKNRIFPVNSRRNGNFLWAAADPDVMKYL
jgi:hypothetical protein